jgi:hypothetical protein
MVGLTVRRVGHGTGRQFGILGAACAAFGWALGTWLGDVALLAKEVARPFPAVLSGMGLSDSMAFAVRISDEMDLLFLAIAVWEGYRFAVPRKPKLGLI